MNREAAIRRVRALRAQAESSGYPAESRAYATKANVLITEHALTETELADPEPELFGTLLSGMFSRFSDPTYKKQRKEQRRLLEKLRRDVFAAIRFGATIEEPTWRAEYFEDFRKQLLQLQDGFSYDRATKETIDGVRACRDKALAEAFDNNCTFILRNAHLYRYRHMTDDEWRDRVRTRAETMTATHGMTDRTIRTALRRANGYKRFYTVLFPKAKDDADVVK